jgi:DNA-directed RNA polymerase specialized sigma24 family protein
MQRAIEALARQRLVDARHSGESNEIEDGELARHLLEKSSLTPLQERVIRMMYLEGKSLGEVAGSLSRNPGTVRQHHDRAIRKMAALAACLGVAP